METIGCGVDRRSASVTAGALAAHGAPVVAAVEPHTAPATADRGARLARERGTGLAFVCVRPAPAVSGTREQHRVSKELVLARKALDTAIAVAGKHGVMSYGEIVEGDPATQIVEFAATRNAAVLVVGRRRHMTEQSVSRQVIALSTLPVVVAAEPRSRRPSAANGSSEEP